MLQKVTVCVIFMLMGVVGCARQVSIQSPDGTIEMFVQTGQTLSYSVRMDDQIIVADSLLQLEFADGFIQDNLKLLSHETTAVDQTWAPVVGRKARIRDRYNEATLVFQEPAGKQRQFSLICRVYDDGVAFRYFFDRSFGEKLTLHEEHTQFAFQGNPVAWPALLNSYTTMHEVVFPRDQLARISSDDIVGLPLTIQLDKNRYCSVTEASLVDWAGMYLTRHGQSTAWLESDPVQLGQMPWGFDEALPDGADTLRIVVDALGSNAFDHVDIVDLKVTLKDGSEKWLSDHKPIQARQGWGSLKMNQSVDGNPLTIAGTVYQQGLGTHADGVIVFTLPEGSRRLSGKVGIDSEVKQQGKAKVRFYVTSSKQEPDKTILKTTLSRLNHNPRAVEAATPHYSPWRVIQLGRKPADLLNSDIILNLNEPSKISDTSWIKPGVTSWNWLSCGGDMDMALLKGFIDLSASMGWDYALIDDGWYRDGNCTKPIDGLDMQELVKYAASKNVRLWVWTHWEALNKRMEETFALYQQWGIAGVKIDFMSRDDQWMVNWHHTVLEQAAKHKLMIDFHGCYKPTGELRTWPNFMTCEAVYGNEQSLGSRTNDPVHKTTLPFTRQLAGPMDYTPGSMLNETRQSWSAQRPIKTLGTRCQELGLLVIYDSLLISMADKPENYYGQDGIEFMKHLPASWDDTLVLDGQIGEYIIMARRKGTTWYLAAITNWDARTLQVPLSFLGAGKYQVLVFEDGPDANTNARQVSRRQMTVQGQDNLSIKMASGGGVVAMITKID